MKQFKITIHDEDRECIITADDKDKAREKFDNNEIDGWLTAEFEQSEITVKEIK